MYTFEKKTVYVHEMCIIVIELYVDILYFAFLVNFKIKMASDTFSQFFF